MLVSRRISNSLVEHTGLAIADSVCEDRAEVCSRWASLRRAVANTVSELCLATETSWVDDTVDKRAAERRTETDHVVDAGLLSKN